MAKRHQTDRRPTISHIAQLAGVSPATVSKVMNGRADVAAPTRERVEQIIIEQGFRRDRVRRAAPKGQTRTVQLLLPRLDDDYFYAIIEGTAQVLRAAGIRLELLSSSDLPEEEVHWIDPVAGHALDGMLVVLPSEEAIVQLEHSQWPFVLIHNQGGLLSPAPSVRITSWEGGFVATKYLIDLGHTRIAYIGKSTTARDAIERLAGYRAALDATHLPIDPQLQCAGNFKEADGYAAAKELFALPEPPTAIFAGNDRQAVGVYRALREMGIAVPDDVSVVGFDNLPFSELLSPPLTTVHAPRMELGQTAASMLLRLLDGERVDMPRVVLPTKFVERQSCRRRP